MEENQLGKDLEELGQGFQLDSREKAEYVRDLCDRVEKNVDLSNEAFSAIKQRIDEVRESVNYALSRHLTVSWKVILGVIISLFIINYFHKDAKNDVNRAKAVVNTIKSKEWKQSDTLIPFEHHLNKEYGKNDYALKNYKTAGEYRYTVLRGIAIDLKKAEYRVDYYTKCADTASTRAAKKDYLKKAKESEKNVKKLMSEGKRVEKMSARKLRKHALLGAKDTLNKAKHQARKIKFWLLFFLFLTPLYVIANRPYGYAINKYKEEGEALEGLAAVGWYLSGFFLALGDCVPTYTVIRKYSSGRVEKSTETDMLGGMIIILSFIAAVIIFCLTSMFIMTISTAVGLARNYDWSNVKEKTMEKYDEIKDKVQS